MVGEALFPYALLALGVPLLWKGADLLVGGGVNLARRLGVSSLTIGLTVVSFGTSAPEFAVNVLAAVRGSTSLAIGNILGSNVANLLLILGAAALVREVVVARSTLRVELPFSIFAAMLVALLAFGVPGLTEARPDLGRIDAVILIVAFVGFMVYVARSGEAPTTVATAESDGREEVAPAVAAMYVITGAAALALGGHWLVEGALVAAGDLGLSEEAIGFTVVAIGTSLPELVTSMVAAAKGESDIAVGNVVGSNVFNLLWVLGVTAAIAPIPLDLATREDIAVVVGASLVVLTLAQARGRLGRPGGLALVVAYVAYVAFVALRG